MRECLRWRGGVALTTVILGAAFLTGCTASTEALEEPSATPSPVPSGQANVFSLVVGDCFDDEGQTELTTVEIIDCNQPHTYEAYFSVLMDDGEFPGEEAIAAFADEQCRIAFEQFVGVAEPETSLAFTYYSPLQESWDTGNDREILCIAGDLNGPVAEPLVGAGPRYPRQ